MFQTPSFSNMFQFRDTTKSFSEWHRQAVMAWSSCQGGTQENYRNDSFPMAPIGRAWLSLAESLSQPWEAGNFPEHTLEKLMGSESSNEPTPLFSAWMLTWTFRTAIYQFQTVGRTHSKRLHYIVLLRAFRRQHTSLQKVEFCGRAMMGHPD